LSKKEGLKSELLNVLIAFYLFEHDNQLLDRYINVVISNNNSKYLNIAYLILAKYFYNKNAFSKSKKYCIYSLDAEETQEAKELLISINNKYEVI
jgi:hypothetical protein